MTLVGGAAPATLGVAPTLKRAEGRPEGAPGLTPGLPKHTTTQEPGSEAQPWWLSAPALQLFQHHEPMQLKDKPSMPTPVVSASRLDKQPSQLARAVVAVAHDEAFAPCFPGDVAALESAGAQVVLFSPLHDSHLPAGCQGVYLGGSRVLPQLCQSLAANGSMRMALRAFCTAGGVLFAQSAGLAYLSRYVTLDEGTGAQVAMVDLLPFRAVLHSAYTQPTEAFVQLNLAPAAKQLLAGTTTQDNKDNSDSSPVIHAYLYSDVNLVEELAHSLGPVGGQHGRQQPAYSSAFVATSASSPPVTGSQLETDTAETAVETSPARTSQTGEAGWAAGYCVHNVVASAMHWPLDAYPHVLDSWVSACGQVNPTTVHAAVTKAVDGWLKATAFPGDRHVHFSTAPQLADLPTLHQTLPGGVDVSSYPNLGHAHAAKVAHGDFHGHPMSSTEQLVGLSHVRHSQAGSDSAKLQEWPQPWTRHSLNGQVLQSHAMDGLSRVGSCSSINSSTCAGCAGQGLAVCSPRTCGQPGSLPRNLTADLSLLEQRTVAAAQSAALTPRTLARPISLQELSRQQQQRTAAVAAAASTGMHVVAGGLGHPTLPPLPTHPPRAARASLGDLRPGAVCSYDVQQMRRQNGLSLDLGVSEVVDTSYGASTAPRTVLGGFSASGPKAQAGPGKLWNVPGFVRPHNATAPALVQPAGPWPAGSSIAAAAAAVAAGGVVVPAAGAYHQGVACIAECDENDHNSANPLPVIPTTTQSFTPSFRTPLPSTGDLHALHAPASTRTSTELVASQLHQGHPARVYSRSGSSASLAGTDTMTHAPQVSAYQSSVMLQQAGSVPYWLNGSVGCSDGIISLCPGATEVLVFMGLAGRLVGISDRCDWPLQLRKVLPYACQHYSSTRARDQARASAALWKSPSSVQLDNSTTGDAAMLLVDEDLLREERPALVVLPHLCRLPSADQQALQRAVQRTVLSPSNPLDRGIVLEHACYTLNDVLESILQIGDITGAPQAAGLLVSRLRARLRLVACAAASRTVPDPRVLVVTSVKPTITCAGNWLPEMLSLTGAQQASMHNLVSSAASAGSGASAVALPREPGEPDVELSWEQVVALAPEVLVVAGCVEGGTLDQVAELAALPGWWSLPAVMAGAVYCVDQALLTRPGPRLVDGVEVLSSIVQQHEKQACAGQSLPPQPIQPAPGTWRTHTTSTNSIAAVAKCGSCLSAAAAGGGAGLMAAADASQATSPEGSADEGGTPPPVLKLTLWGGQRCRPSLLPKYFAPWPAATTP